MYEAVQQCKHCLAQLTLDDMRKPNCGYCGTVFPHHALAAQHANVVGQVMGQVMGQAMAQAMAQQAQMQDQWRGGFGVGPMAPPGQYGAPPGSPYGAPPGSPYGAPPGSPYGDPYAMMQNQMAHAQRMSRGVMTTVWVSLAVTFLIVGIVMFVVFQRL